MISRALALITFLIKAFSSVALQASFSYYTGLKLDLKTKSRLLANYCSHEMLSNEPSYNLKTKLVTDETSLPGLQHDGMYGFKHCTNDMDCAPWRCKELILSPRNKYITDMYQL